MTSEFKRPDNFIHQDDVEWREAAFGENYAFRGKSFTKPSGARELGCGLFVQKPGKRAFPQHYHLAIEEAVYVLKGEGVVVCNDREVPIRAGDYVSFPAGAEYAHQIWNNSDADLEYLCLSTMKDPDVAIYPKTGKVGIFAGFSHGRDPKDMTYCKFLYPQECDYWDGEEEQ